MTSEDHDSHSISTSIGPSTLEKSPPEQLRGLDITGVEIHYHDGVTEEHTNHEQPDQEQGDREQELGIESKSYDGNFSSDLCESVSRTQTRTLTLHTPSSRNVATSTSSSGIDNSTASDTSTGSSQVKSDSTGAGITTTAGEAGGRSGPSAARGRTPIATAVGGGVPTSGQRTTPTILPSKRIPVPGRGDAGPSTLGNTPAASQRTNGIEAAPEETGPNNVATGARTPAPSEIKVVVAGKSGAGKSALINTLLHAEREDGEGEEEIQEIALTPDSTTDRLENKQIRQKRDNVTICMVDTPGFKNDRKTKKKQLKELSKFTDGGKADLLIYCIPVAPGMKFDDANPTIMKALQDVLGREVWQHCIVVFTFSNLAWEHIRSSTQREVPAVDMYKDYIRSYTERFKQELVKLIGLNVEVGAIFDCPTHPRLITAVPAGYRVQDRVLTTDQENWKGAIFEEMIEKCKGKHKTDFLRYRYREVMAEKVLGKNGAQVLAGSAGGAALVVGGAVVGSVVGLPGGPIGMVIGGTIGASVGIVASTVMSGGIALNKDKDT